MFYIDPNQNPTSESYIPPTNDNNSNEASASKLYHILIFTVPICFTFIVLFVLYVIYLRRIRIMADWYFLGIRGDDSFVSTNNLSMAELGLRKEVREMLPIVIFKECFSINDSQCSVCLGDYQADEKLLKIPACGHSFHMDCIDLWLTSHTTCSLCRISLIPKASLNHSHQNLELISSINNSDGRGASAQPEPNSIIEIGSHIDDGQEGDGHSREVIDQSSRDN